MSKRWMVVFQTRTERGWSDDMDRWWPCFCVRAEALRFKAEFNTPCLAQRGERYVVRRVK